MKKILLCTDGSLFADSCYRYGAWFAMKLAAEVDVLYVTDIRSQQVASTGNLSGSIGLGASEALLNQLIELEHEKAKLNHQRTKLILQAAEQTLKAEGVEQIKLIHEIGFLVDCFHEFESNSDLIVLGKRGESAEFASGHLGANLERIVRSSHKPCLITSRQFKPIERLLLAYDGSLSCKKMLQFMIDSPVFKNLELHIVTVAKSGENHTAMPTAAQERHAGMDQARQKVRTAGFEPVCSLIEGEPETAIANYITEQDISLLLMGAYGHSRIRHLVIGSTTAQMLHSSNIPVLLFR